MTQRETIEWLGKLPRVAVKPPFLGLPQPIVLSTVLAVLAAIAVFR